MHRIIRLPEVKKQTGLATSTIYKKMSQKTFPSQVPLGSKSVGWDEREVQAWIVERIEEAKTFN